MDRVDSIIWTRFRAEVPLLFVTVPGRPFDVTAGRPRDLRPWKGVSPDHERLRAVGFDDKGILQITLIASWFNYINRVADALGVGRD